MFWSEFHTNQVFFLLVLDGFDLNEFIFRNKKAPRFPMVSNMKTGPGTLGLEIRGMAFVSSYAVEIFTLCYSSLYCIGVSVRGTRSTNINNIYN